MATIQSTIIKKLDVAFSPDHLEVINESASHNVPEGSESHFKVTLVSQTFDGMRSVKRHQAVYGVLAEYMGSPIHALALHTYTADEWGQREGSPDSPNCLGGGKA